MWKLATEKHGKNTENSFFFCVIPWLKRSRLAGVGIKVGILFSGNHFSRTVQPSIIDRGFLFFFRPVSLI